MTHPGNTPPDDFDINRLNKPSAETIAGFEQAFEALTAVLEPHASRVQTQRIVSAFEHPLYDQVLEVDCSQSCIDTPVDKAKHPRVRSSVKADIINDGERETFVTDPDDEQGLSHLRSLAAILDSSSSSTAEWLEEACVLSAVPRAELERQSVSKLLLGAPNVMFNHKTTKRIAKLTEAGLYASWLESEMKFGSLEPATEQAGARHISLMTPEGKHYSYRQSTKGVVTLVVQGKGEQVPSSHKETEPLMPDFRENLLRNLLSNAGVAPADSLLTPSEGTLSDFTNELQAVVARIATT